MNTTSVQLRKKKKKTQRFVMPSKPPAKPVKQ